MDAKRNDQQEPGLGELAELAVGLCKKHGAAEAAATATENRSVDVTWRDAKLEQLSEATTRQLVLELYVDGRYSLVATSDLRPEALDPFIADSLALARALAPDPHRQLPDPSLYAGRSAADLDLVDASVLKLGDKDRRHAAEALVAAARGVADSGAIQSVTGQWSDAQSEMVRVASNGFSGGRRTTDVSAVVSVSCKDTDGRRPEEYAYAWKRFRADLPSLAEIGAEGAKRALGRLGQVKGKSESLTMAVENRAAGGLLRMLQGPMSGGALQQKRSFLDGQLGKTLGSKLLDLRDEPLLRRGLGSRHFDGEGLTARTLPLFEQGVLKNFLVDTYYGRKLGVAPTTAGTSNLVLTPGSKSLPRLLADIGEGILVTGFLGGNNNAATGDFSLGVSGFRVRKGQLAEPIGEMNIGGNQRELWPRLVAVGNDPWTSSTARLPTLVFEGVMFAGT